MTAEVGVLNRLGVALAADSAVTLDGPGKIYTSANKLFQLSLEAPVGAMVYGGADLLGVPWETVIKAYREELGGTTFDKLSDYMSHLISFLEANRTLFPERLQAMHTQQLTARGVSFLQHQLEERLTKEFEKLGRIPKDEVPGIFESVVDPELAKLDDMEDVEDLPDDFAKKATAKYDEGIRDAARQLLQQFPVSDALLDKLVSFTVTSLTKQGCGGLYSGVVLAGFGDSEYFPSLVDVKCQGIALDTVLKYGTHEASIDPEENSALVVPFAQGEMVATFMDGIDPALRSMLLSETGKLLDGVSDRLLADVSAHDPTYASELAARFGPQLETLKSKLPEKLSDATQKGYSGPVMQIVTSLPKDELAGIAESLVNLAKFKKRISAQQETVGGPIDVAMISKGDGFIWVRRKHYFKPELNPRFFARRGLGGQKS